MTTQKKVKSFVTEVIARMKGDTPKVVAEKNYRTADAAITAQIATLKADAVKKENAVEDAVEKLNAAKYPVDPITNTESYVQGIVNAQEAVNAAEKALKNTEETIKYFEDMKAENDADTSETAE